MIETNLNKFRRIYLIYFDAIKTTIFQISISGSTLRLYLLYEVHLGNNLTDNFHHTKNLKLPTILIFPSPLTSPKTLWRKLASLTLSLSVTLQYYIISEQPKIASASGKNHNKNVSFDLIIYTLLGYKNSLLRLSMLFLFKQILLRKLLVRRKNNMKHITD